MVFLAEWKKRIDVTDLESLEWRLCCCYCCW